MPYKKARKLEELTAAEAAGELRYVEALRGHDAALTRKAATEWAEAAAKVKEFVLQNQKTNDGE